jgi:hypothetical protein
MVSLLSAIMMTRSFSKHVIYQPKYTHAIKTILCFPLFVLTSTIHAQDVSVSEIITKKNVRFAFYRCPEILW